MEINILEVLDTIVKEITKKIGKIEIYNIDLISLNENNSNSVIITTVGDYNLTIVLYAEITFMQAITENMKRGKILDIAEIDLYIKEYFNILCGRVITTMNNTIKKSAKFTVPNVVKGIYLMDVTQENLDIEELYYKSNYGFAKVQTIYEN